MLERSNTISPRFGGQAPDSGETRSIVWAVKSGSAVRAISTDSSGPVTRRAVADRRPSASATPGMPRTTSTRSLSNGTVVKKFAELGFVSSKPSARFCWRSAFAPAIVPTAVTPTAIDRTTSRLRTRCSFRSRPTFRHRTEPRANGKRASGVGRRGARPAVPASPRSLAANRGTGRGRRLPPTAEAAVVQQLHRLHRASRTRIGSPLRSSRTGWAPRCGRTRDSGSRLRRMAARLRTVSPSDAASGGGARDRPRRDIRPGPERSNGPRATGGHPAA